LLFQMALAGDEKTTPRAQNAIDYIVTQVSHPKIKTSSVGLHASKISAISWS